MYQQIKELPDFVKDSKTGALLNTNNKALKAYKDQKEMFAKINKHEQQISKIEKDVSEIKDMLQTLLKVMNVA